ncbi:MAG: ROK family protein [Lawsonibacter sp.]|jgi:glucokinase|nr:ROK family protein [Lawsonibacter sp.]
MFYIGIDVGGTNLVAGLVNELGHIFNQVTTPVAKDMTAEQFGAELVRMSRRLCEVGEIDPSKIQSVGIGLPGAVDNKAGLFVQNPNMPFRDKNVPLREMFQKEWDIPVFLGNDANCAAVGEYWAGAAKGCDPAVMVTLGTGIGGGMICNGKLFTGFANAGMEVGHMIIKPNGILCGCGSRGCWERYGSATALIQLARLEMERDRSSEMWNIVDGDSFKVSGRTTFQAARLGDPAAKRVLHSYLEGLSVGMINLVNILQPEIICLGGGVSNAEDDLLLDPLRELVWRGCFDKTNRVRIEKASLGNNAGVVGAALLCNLV